MSQLKNHLQKHLTLLFYLSYLFSFLILFAPNAPRPTAIPYFDTVIHFCLFATLALITSLKYPKAKSHVPIFLTAYSFFSEIIQQYFIPGRGFEFIDLSSDLVGVITGLTLLALYKQKVEF